MNQVLSSIVFPLSYYFMGLRFMALVALIAVLLYVAGSHSGRLPQCRSARVPRAIEGPGKGIELMPWKAHPVAVSATQEPMVRIR